VIKVSKSLGKDIIFMLTRDEILACSNGLGISEEQVTDDVIELVKSRINLEFRHWPVVVRNALREAIKCPLGLVCYPSCFWWKDEKCTFPRED